MQCEREVGRSCKHNIHIVSSNFGSSLAHNRGLTSSILHPTRIVPFRLSKVPGSVWKMPNFRGCQPFLVIVKSPDGSTYQFVMPAYICIRVVGTWKSQIPLRTMAEEYLEEHVDWKALLDDPEHDVVFKARRIRPFRRWREY